MVQGVVLYKWHNPPLLTNYSSMKIIQYQPSINLNLIAARPAPDIVPNGSVERSVSRKPPKHYRLRINSFSSLKSKEKYESNEFKAGGYKWKLVLFPNGNKNRGVKDHISLYLELGGEQAIKPGKIVTIDYKLFLLNRPKGSYLVLKHSNKEEKKYCIYRTIVGGLAGFDRFIPLNEFSDVSNGYLIDDLCEFGAEILVSETTRKGKGECVFSKDPASLLGFCVLGFAWILTTIRLSKDDIGDKLVASSLLNPMDVRNPSKSKHKKSK